MKGIKHAAGVAWKGLKLTQNACVRFQAQASQTFGGIRIIFDSCSLRQKSFWTKAGDATRTFSTVVLDEGHREHLDSDDGAQGNVDGEAEVRGLLDRHLTSVRPRDAGGRFADHASHQTQHGPARVLQFALAEAHDVKSFGELHTVLRVLEGGQRSRGRQGERRERSQERRLVETQWCLCVRLDRKAQAPKVCAGRRTSGIFGKMCCNAS